MPAQRVHYLPRTMAPHQPLKLIYRDGSAVVTINHGVRSDYRFTGLRASTTYYFQIWAYSNTGSNIDYLTSPAGPANNATTNPTVVGQTFLLQENFETDGHPDRYTASSGGGFLSGPSGYFHRTGGSNIAIFSGSYAGFSDAYFWAAEDTDNPAGDDNREQTLVFTDIDIAGFTNLRFSGLFGAGNTGFNFLL